MNVVDVSGLTKRFGDRTVVDNISLRVRQREIVGFLGPNGSGKTTTIRMLCGLLNPDAANGTCLGYDIIREAALIKLQTGYMTQRFSFYEDLTIEENLDFVARLYNLQPRRQKVEEALERIGLGARRKQLAVGNRERRFSKRTARLDSIWPKRAWSEDWVATSSDTCCRRAPKAEFLAYT
jgi:ABC-2 type transport system ATP-binding protein